MKEIPVILFGAGGVGQALLQLIVNGRSRVAERNQCRFNIVAIIDSKTWVWQPEGLTDAQLHDIIAAKKHHLPVDPAWRQEKLRDQKRPSDTEILEIAHQAGLKQAIVVDVTAANGMEPVIDQALELGYGVALANKKPLAGPWQTAQKYFNHPLIRHESTVGGGQPVIATLRYLLDVNDPILEIEGQLSGTLGYICARLDEGVPFSQAVAAAKALGYTEPDPRDDLGGKDVMRKIMILGRMAGWPLEETDIEVESLYPSALAHLSVTEFMAATIALDPPMRERVETAVSQGNVLRYIAHLEKGHGKVGLQPIPAQSPLANLKYISFRTACYNDEPLLIGGKGAGVEMTAAGVLGDMIDLVRETR
ncbi:MAG: homoserine dehydrogenase [Chloroflexi bacterium]|nr:MAG: homoserine dehydrogenase [Chloroflexota bacterium]